MRTRSPSYYSLDTASASLSSATGTPSFTPVIEYYYPRYATGPGSSSSHSRSPSPWSDMAPSVHGDDEVEMTDSPASSYASIDRENSPTPHHPEECLVEEEAGTSRIHKSKRPRSPSYETERSAPRPKRIRILSPQPQSRQPTERKAAKKPGAATQERQTVTRAARVRELKLKAQGITRNHGNKTPAPEHQRAVLRMVYDQITPYPDEAWISQLAVHFNCPYDKIKNWFSNTRQKDASEYRTLHPREKYDLAATLRSITCEGRELRMRPSALEHCDEEQWTDNFFYEVVLINDFRMMVRTRNQQLAREAAFGMLDLRVN